MDVSSFVAQGTRPEQEDRFRVCRHFAGFNHLSLFVVCDGHGGHLAADFLIERFTTVLVSNVKRCNATGEKLTVLMAQALDQCVKEWDHKCFGETKIACHADKVDFFAKRDEKIWSSQQLESGSTICAVLVDLKERIMNVMNLGDSRATWICNNWKLRGATIDHSVPLKMDPVPNFPFTYGDGYVANDLAMCKSFGDNTESLYGVIGRIPDLLNIKIGSGPARLVVATDGFFDWVSDHSALYDEFDSATKLVEQMDKMDDNVTVIYVKISAESTEKFISTGSKTISVTETTTTKRLPNKTASRRLSPGRANRANKAVESKPKKTTLKKTPTTHKLKEASDDGEVISDTKKPTRKSTTEKKTESFEEMLASLQIDSEKKGKGKKNPSKKPPLN